MRYYTLDTYKTQLGAELAELILADARSIRQIAGAIGVHHANLHKMLHGKRAWTGYAIARLCSIYGIDVVVSASTAADTGA